jgi:methanogenic corrinoid protein MtbC1
LRALLSGSRPEALALARDALAVGRAYLYEEVVTTALHQLGELWYANSISVAEEHLATALAESVVASLYPDLRWVQGGAKAVVACADGERHQLGARMVADLLALDGWDVAYLGADVPASTLLAYAKANRPRLVAISVALSSHVDAALRTLAALRAELPDIRLALGGRALAYGHRPEVVGVDIASTSASAAVFAAR